MSLLNTVLWPGLKALVKHSRLGGICADKPGYHDRSSGLPGSDYSKKLAADKVTGALANECAAIDWTFPDAQRGNYTTIAKFSARLYAAGRARDPRTVYMREFYGNTDKDTHVEGWDFHYDVPVTSDKSHLWHIHISIHRKYVNSPIAIDAILSILKGEALAVWRKRWGLAAAPAVVKTAVKKVTAPPTKHTVKRGETLTSIAAKYRTTVGALVKLNGIRNPNVINVGQSIVIRPATKAVASTKSPIAKARSLKPGMKGEDVACVQRFLGIKDDGIFGPQTARAVSRYRVMRGIGAGTTVGIRTRTAIKVCWK